MRSSLAFVLVTAFAGGGSACNGTAPGPDAGAAQDGGSPPPARGFQIVSPNVDINPGDEVTYCYYFRTPNSSNLQIKKWASYMTDGSRDMILYLTPTDQQTPGTLSTSKCGLFSSGPGPVWTYSAQTRDAEALLPADDGNGVPVGQLIKSGQSGFLQMHYRNTTDAVIHAHVELNAYAYDEGVQVTPAAPFVTFNTLINLPAATSMLTPTTGMVNGSCSVPSDAKFYVMSTHTHKQGVHTFIKDGATTVFDSTSWEQPGARTWDTAPFYSFTSGKLTYQCEYVNPNNYRIGTGDNAATDETCMAIGYYFPAVEGTSQFCLNSMIL
jgi:hypothetical protein